MLDSRMVIYATEAGSPGIHRVSFIAIMPAIQHGADTNMALQDRAVLKAHLKLKVILNVSTFTIQAQDPWHHQDIEARMTKLDTSAIYA